jgi:hypothetical protein
VELRYCKKLGNDSIQFRVLLSRLQMLEDSERLLRTSCSPHRQRNSIVVAGLERRVEDRREGAVLPLKALGNVTKLTETTQSSSFRPESRGEKSCRYIPQNSRFNSKLCLSQSFHCIGGGGQEYQGNWHPLSVTNRGTPTMPKRNNKQASTELQSWLLDEENQPGSYSPSSEGNELPQPLQCRARWRCPNLFKSRLLFRALKFTAVFTSGVLFSL